MKLIVVESPSKAKKISEYVGDDYVVLASVGHINELAKNGKFGIGVDVNNKFKTQYILMKDKINVLNEIIDTAAKSEMILLASDDDREGEAIANHIKNYLVSTGKPIKRIKFHEITKSAILKALESPQDLDKNLIEAQECRRVLDRLVGFLVSPMLQQFHGQGLSSGRVQSVAVRLITDREKEIDTFKPVEYWNIYSTFLTKSKQNLTVKYDHKINNEADTNKVIALIKSKDDYFVSKLQAKQQKQKPPPPLITAKLQQTAAKKYGLDAEQVMKAAQSLYENGYCTYIRTDSVACSDESVKSVRKWIKEANYDLPKSANIYEAKSTAQAAHECIRPTNINTIPNQCVLSGTEKDIYTLIWQCFVASQMNSAVYNTLVLQVSSKSEKSLVFKATGKALEYKGYLEILGNIEETKIDIPNVELNEDLLLLPEFLKKEQKFTQPPARFNDATINEELESRQIGRPSTLAEIIKKITAKNYVEKKGSTFRPTELGKKITDILVKDFDYMNYNYTAELEKQLDDIADGKLQYLDMLNSFYKPFSEKLKQAYKNNGAELCEKCERPMITRTNKTNGDKFLGCSGFPLCRNIKPIK